MDGGEIQGKPQIIVDPENWEEVKKKYIEREEEQISKMLEKKKVETVEELEHIATLSIINRAKRASPEHRPLKDHTIQVEAKSSDIQELKQKIHEEITAVAKSHFHVPTTEKREELKGRITVRNPENSTPPKEGQS